MIWLICVVTALAIVGIALWFVGHGVAKTQAMPKQVVYDVHDSIEFCAEALPDHITADVSYDELRRALRLHLEWVQAYHFSPDLEGETPLVFEEFDAVDYMVERADIVELDLSREQLVEIVRAHTHFLRVMGAIHDESPAQIEKDLADIPMLEAGPETQED